MRMSQRPVDDFYRMAEPLVLSSQRQDLKRLFGRSVAAALMQYGGDAAEDIEQALLDAIGALSRGIRRGTYEDL